MSPQRVDAMRMYRHILPRQAGEPTMSPVVDRELLALLRAEGGSAARVRGTGRRRDVRLMRLIQTGTSINVGLGECVPRATKSLQTLKFLGFWFPENKIIISLWESRKFKIWIVVRGGRRKWSQRLAPSKVAHECGPMNGDRSRMSPARAFDSRHEQFRYGGGRRFRHTDPKFHDVRGSSDPSQSGTEHRQHRARCQVRQTAY